MKAGLRAAMSGAFRRVERLVARRGLILLYHRIGEPGRDPWDLAVTPAHFSEHLEVLRKVGRPMRFGDLPDAMRGRRVPRKALVVTFDDGYADNLLKALPRLANYDVPATVFVASGAIDRPEEFWWDELERILLSQNSVPAALEVVVAGRPYSWSLTGAAGDHESIRYTVYRSLWQLLRPLPEAERGHVRAQLRAWAGVPADARETHRTLTRAELVELAAGGLVDVGCHSVTHPQLSTLPSESQRAEITGSRDALERVLGRPITTFAYPFGDHSDDTISLLRQSGFHQAAATTRGCVTADTDLFRLPRLHVRDMDGEGFARMLDRHLSAD